MTSRRTFFHRPRLHRAGLTVTAGALVLLVAAPAGASESAAPVGTRLNTAAGGSAVAAPAAGSALGAASLAAPAGKVKVNTFGDWDGSSALYPFGNPDTATYGQTFTSASKPSEMKKFVFDLAGAGGSGPIVYGAYVYRWDGEHAVGSPLWQTERSRTFREGHYRQVQFVTAGTEPKLEPSTEYVVFLSVSATYEETSPNTYAQWAFVPEPDAYPGGHAVYLNNGGDESQWTTVPWTSVGTGDFVTKINTKTTG